MVPYGHYPPPAPRDPYVGMTYEGTPGSYNSHPPNNYGAPGYVHYEHNPSQMGYSHPSYAAPSYNYHPSPYGYHRNQAGYGYSAPPSYGSHPGK